MDLGQAASQEGRISRILDERVFEDIGSLRRQVASDDETGLHELGESLIECGALQRRNRGQQLMVEFPADAGRHLCQLFHGCEVVEPGHERVLQCGRNGHCRQDAIALEAVAGIPQLAGFDDRPGQLFDEQRDAVRLVRDLLEDIGW